MSRDVVRHETSLGKPALGADRRKAIRLGGPCGEMHQMRAAHLRIIRRWAARIWNIVTDAPGVEAVFGKVPGVGEWF